MCFHLGTGLDDRSQFDMIEALPGGLAGLRALIEGLHERAKMIVGNRARPSPPNKSSLQFLG